LAKFLILPKVRDFCRPFGAAANLVAQNKVLVRLAPQFIFSKPTAFNHLLCTAFSVPISND
jgi:hypothetical protein